ncbi:hypothetical protein [Nocardiopsis ganjiahuensis]|uniref:hypothetical protein n=1 Tax=Nocardiopsis ganjiahuensis TaxID=239984 RepID=UPI0004764F95|nr:hypothetical protein [Nocardiopsis ganjiahuensis]
MSPSPPRRSRTGPAWTRVLLIGVLLLGFGAMHTLGHLQHEAHASTASPGAQLAAPTPAPHVHGGAGAGHTAATGVPAGSGHGSATGPAAEAGTHSPTWDSASWGDGEHAAALPELDPTSACLTLGSFAVVLLGVAAIAFTRWPGPPLSPAGPVPRLPRSPFPTPDEPSLARLQVLRV